MLKSPIIDFCSILSKGKNSQNPLIKSIGNVMKKNFLVFLNCPWQGTMGIENITIDKALVSFLPNGKYRFNNI